MENNNYNFDYTDFDPDQDRSVKNDKIYRTHQQILGDAVRGTQLQEYWKEDENKKRLIERCRELGLLSKELGLVKKNMDKGRHTQWVLNYEKYAENLREHIRNWGPEVYAKLIEGGKKGGRTRGDHIMKFGQHPNSMQALEESRDPQKAADARKVIQCKVCGTEGLTGNINRWHNDNCKVQKLKDAAEEHLPTTDFRFFDIPDILQVIADKSGYKLGKSDSVIWALKKFNVVEKTNIKGRYKKK